MSATDAFDQLERLADLKSKGIITDTEFEAKKQELLSGTTVAAAPLASNVSADTPAWNRLTLTQKWWFVWVIALLFWPAGMVMMWIKPQYYMKGGKVTRVTVAFKVFGHILILALVMWGLVSLASLGAE